MRDWDTSKILISRSILKGSAWGYIAKSLSLVKGIDAPGKLSISSLEMGKKMCI
jgi:hypothetical protein